MKFKSDILLIYHEENDSGWVEQFKSHLKSYLERILKSKIEISAAESEKVKNEDDLSAYAVIIPVITAGFLESKSCLFALENFLDQSKNDVKTSFKGYDRIFKVVREPFDRNLLPPKIIENHRYNFYEKDLLTDEIIRYQAKDQNTANHDERYWFALNDISYDIRDILTQIKTFGFAGGAETSGDKKIVYLAETSEDLISKRNIIKRDLIRHGYHVLPEKSLDRNDKILEEKIKRDIEKSCLAIHMLGNEYGAAIDGQEISLMDWQNKISEGYSNSVLNQVSDTDNSRKFRRLIWISQDPDEATSKQKNYVEGIRKKAELMDDTDILESPIEDLKTAIRDELKFGHRRFSTRYKPNEAGSRFSNNVYIIFNKNKEKESEQVVNLLHKQGYKTSNSSYEGPILTILKNHQQQLRNCDAAIVLYTDESPLWLDAKIKDLLKSPGLGRKSPMVAKAILKTGNEDVENKHLDRLNAMVISTSGSLNEKILTPFFEKFELIK